MTSTPTTKIVLSRQPCPSCSSSDAIRNKESRKRWKLRHPEKHKEIQKLNARKRRVKNPVKFMLIAAKGRAKRLNIPFDLITEDIVIPEICPVLGIKLERSLSRFNNNSPTLDRIQPDLGYTKGNVRVISHRANALKSNMTLEEGCLVLKDLENVRNN